ncbi:Hypothetical protein D9617_53g017670 [Elsinoe fawcettii]|nr:Hypothetical protein D9617_53g017670 [Elsinoe fawcettii]
MNVCNDPYYAQTYGFFISPLKFISTEFPILILSLTDFFTFGDILTPSFAYWSGLATLPTTMNLTSTGNTNPPNSTGLARLPVSATRFSVKKFGPTTELHRQRLISLSLYNTTFTRLVQYEEESCD